MTSFCVTNRHGGPRLFSPRFWIPSVILAGCAAEVPDPGDGFEIVVEHVVRIGEAEGPGLLGGQLSLHRLVDGRYALWDMTRPGEVRLFAPDGRYLSTVGRPGDGPGEFRHASFATLDPTGDSLYIVDRSHGRLSVFSSDGEVFHEARLFPIGIAARVWALPDGRFLTNSLSMTAEGVGLPLHLVDRGGNRLASFGTDFPVFMADLPRGHFRRVHVTAEGVVWVVPMHDYQIERWVPTTPEEGYFVLDTIFHPETTPVEDVSEYLFRPRRVQDGPPSTSVRGVWKEPDGPVWVLLWVPKENWADLVTPDPGWIDLEYFAERTVHRTRIEAFDPDTGAFLGAKEVDPLWVELVENGEGFSFRVDALGAPFMELWRVRRN
jgi:hypothetical protein